MTNKKLYRSSTDKIIAGVCGGLGEYTGIDSTVLRLIAVLVFVFTGFFPVIILYPLAAAVMPFEPTSTPASPAPEEPKM